MGIQAKYCVGLFPLMLKEVVRDWFRTLQLGSVESFEELEWLFITQFMASRRRRCPSMYLLIVKQHEYEILEAYLTFLEKECLATND